MALALFDLDNTLLAGDSDYLWGRFLVQNNLVDLQKYEQENLRFYQEYAQGVLDINEYLAFQLAVLAKNDKSQLDQLRDQFIAQSIKPIIAKQTFSILEKHKKQGDIVVIITATNRFVTAPIAQELGVEHLIATEVEVVNGQYSGRSLGTPCFKEGKVTLLQEWLVDNQQNMSGSWFYSDSHNDLPLLKIVDHPVAVDADEKLTAYAQSHGWPLISFRY